MFWFIVITLIVILSSKAEPRCLLVSLPLQTENFELQKFILNVDILEGENASYCEGQLATEVNDTFEVVLINSKLEYSTLLQFISCSFNNKEKCHEILSCSNNIITGVIGDLDFNTATIIDSLSTKFDQNIVQVAAFPPLNSLPVMYSFIPSVVDMDPLSHHTECLLNLVIELKWNRLALIVENTNYYKYEADLLQKRLLTTPEIIITPYIIVCEKDNTKYALQHIKKSATNIIIVLASERIASIILKEALELNFIWPSYAWILHITPHTESILKMEGAIMLNHYPVQEKPRPQKNFEGICNPINATEQQTACDTLYDSILAAELVGKLKRFNITFPGKTGTVELDDWGKRLINSTLIQIKNNSKVKIGYYNPKSLEFFLYNEFFTSGNIPKGMTVITDGKPSTAHRTMILLAFTSCLIFLFIVMILFIYFHKAPEVKATSITLSMCMFLGSFSLLLFVLILLLLEEQQVDLAPYLAQDTTLSEDFVPVPTKSNVCIYMIWFGGIGLPIPIILTTIFLKMLRIYVIFSHPHSYKRHLLKFSDGALFLYLLIILTPNILLLILWSALDPLVTRIMETRHENFIEKHKTCLSNHIFIWFVILAIYLVILIIAVVIIAFKTSKIPLKDFRDSKATYAFSFITIFVILQTLFYWSFFRSLKPSTTEITAASRYTLYTGHFIVTISCPCLLFIPKIYPSISRWLSRRK